MKQFFTFLAAVVFTASTYAQVGIGTTTPAASAALDITSTTQGLLIPRMLAGERTTIVTPATGLMVFQTDGAAGFYYYNGSSWVAITAGLQSITEGSNTGYRRADASAANYGDIGGGALDLSSQQNTSTETGATGDFSTALGLNTYAEGQSSLAMGAETLASGNNSTAMGNQTNAIGSNSAALGYLTKANGNNSVAMGYQTRTSGESSLAAGANTFAEGIASVAMGNQTTASGTFSTAMGNFTTASDFSSVVIGQYNSKGSTVTDADNFSATAPAFVIGNGTDAANASDAFVVDFSGNTTTPGTVTATGGFIGDGSQLTNLPSSGDAHYVGESYGGGIVFFVYDGGKHGLIAATADQSAGIRWSGGSYTNTRARADGIGAGLKNTAIIIANQGPVDGNAFAATVCNEYSLTLGSVTYGDWYLPSKYELNLMYKNIGAGNALGLGNIGNFTTNYYWSSTEFDYDSACDQSFSNGVQGDDRKNFTGDSVRAVRAF